ncbi:MAG: flavodoxin [Pseudonocardiales bacterium]|nr:MAG: flavodoxin [Pseudonocardiales bacterium]
MCAELTPTKVLLVVHHTTSPSLQELLEAALDGTHADGIEGVEVRVRPALAATAVDVLAADGFVLGTPANIGYMSGALKLFFDNVYYPTLTAKIGAPYGLYVHGTLDTTGAVRAVESITKGMGWERVHEPVLVMGAVGKDATEAVWELAATVAATVADIAGSS